MPLVLVSATSSAYARMNQIALIEKGIPYELRNDVPYNATTKTPEYNPLEKLPILIPLEIGPAVYDSAHIQEYIVQKFADKQPSLLPDDIDAILQAKQIQTLAEGLMDAITLYLFENSREIPSPEWQARQSRKIDGAMLAYSEYAKRAAARNHDWLVDDVFSIADIATGCALGWVDFFGLRPEWKVHYRELAAYWERLSDRESFKSTMHVMSNIVDKVV